MSYAIMRRALAVYGLMTVGAASALQDPSVIIVTMSACTTTPVFVANLTQTSFLSTTSSLASASSSLCGQTIHESGADYTISCNATLLGQTIQMPSSMRRRQSYTYSPPLTSQTIDRCLQDCNAVQDCVAVSLQSGVCSLFSSVQRSVDSVGGIVGYNAMRFAGYTSAPSMPSASVASTTGGSKIPYFSSSSGVESISSNSVPLSVVVSTGSSSTTLGSSSSIPRPATSLDSAFGSSASSTSFTQSSARVTSSASAVVQTMKDPSPIPSSSSSLHSTVDSTMSTSSPTSTMKGPSPIASSSSSAQGSSTSTHPSSSASQTTIVTMAESSDTGSSSTALSVATSAESVTPTPSPRIPTSTSLAGSAISSQVASASDSSSPASSPTATSIPSCDDIDYSAASSTCNDPYGNTFVVDQGKNYLGNIIGRAYVSPLSACLTNCDAMQGCTAVSYIGDQCDMMSRVYGTQTPSGGSPGQVASRPAGVTTTYTAPPPSSPS
ncbi:hypothetical protein LTR53_008581 [Teratosphaeriaceae sp. CCFEE 6253]|nr:hypothetical protein LTR53_008581 [Teratosphaeriaceae sp. CCFEE 6253]